VKPGKRLYDPCRTILNCKRKFNAVLQHEQKCSSEDVYVVEGLEGSLLGRNACPWLEIIAIESMLSKERPSVSTKVS